MYILNGLSRKSAVTTILCAACLALVVVIVCHELHNIYLRNAKSSGILNPYQARVASTSADHLSIKSIADFWRYIRYTTVYKYFHRLKLDIIRNSNGYVSTTLYNSYISAVIFTSIILSIVLLQITSPVVARYTPILAIVSFLTWKPIFILILSTVGYKASRNTSAVLHTLTLQPWLLAFLSLAAFKFFKILVHTISFYFLTNPAQQPVNPTLYPSDVTVIVPSAGEFDDEFIECMETIVANKPHSVIVCTIGWARFTKAQDVCSKISSQSKTKIIVVSVTDSNKRVQFYRGLTDVKTQIVAYVDDHVFWPPTFLRSALAPFEDQRVGLVGTVKKVRRDRSGGFWPSFMNYIACMYLERHNFECTASYNLDGGVFVISGRTSLTRTHIVHHVKFRKAFLDERWLWGTVGPLKVDDDNCITRWMVNHGWRTVFHNSPDAIVETSLGTTGGLEKFRGQLIRWVRTTWRSNSTSLLVDRTCWTVHPWTTYAMFISSFVNIALIYDTLLVLTLYYSGYTQHICTLVIALLVSKIIKPLEHLKREPRDIFFMLPGLLFGYVHSFFKIWAFFTTCNIEWNGRKGIK